jgi:DNA-binding NarL/FixJ family response regulator
MSSLIPVPLAPSGNDADALCPLTILVVEDQDADFRWLQSVLLRMGGFRCAIAHASRISSARALIAAHDFDVAFVDHMLPDGRSTDVLEALRGRANGCAAIMLSGSTRSDVVRSGLMGGAVAAINKDDASPGLIESTVRFAIKNNSRTHDAPRHTVVVSQQGDQALALDSLRRDVLHELEAIGAGVDAIEMLAWSKDSPWSYLSLTRKIKATCERLLKQSQNGL